MSAPLDEAIRKLELLCATLEQANDVLEAAVPDLADRATDLVNREREGRESAAALADETRSFETSLDTWDEEAATATAELGDAASQAVDARLPRLEARMDEAGEHLHQVLTDYSTHLEAESEDLQARGFEPLDVLVAARTSDAERWATDSYAAIGVLAESLETAMAGARSDLKGGADDVRGAGVAVNVSSWASLLHEDLLEIDETLLDSIDTRCDGSEVAGRIGQCVELVQAAVAADRKAAQDWGTEAGAALQGEYRLAADTLAAASDALLAAEQEHAQSEADAGSTHAVVTQIADLGPRIEDANDDCVRIRAVMDAMSPS